MRFSIQSLLTIILVVALLCGWISTLQSIDRIRKRYEQQLEYSNGELVRSKEQLQYLQRGKRPDRNRFFWEAELEGSNLAGMTIASDGNAFQLASFRACNLEGARLRGGTASFQRASFDEAKLKGAALSGEGASGATFVGADLTGATLSGGWGAFADASFENAILVEAKWAGSFERANISGVKFEGADLSAIVADNLISCYFDVPPVYDSRTKFPSGFEPTQHRWQMAK